MRLLLLLPLLASMSVAAQTSPHPGEEQYRRICFVCHDQGVHFPQSRGAPRLGDRVAWSARALRGTERLLSYVVRGRHDPAYKEANLTYAEIRLAIEYMLEQGTTAKPPSE